MRVVILGRQLEVPSCGRDSTAGLAQLAFVGKTVARRYKRADWGRDVEDMCAGVDSGIDFHKACGTRLASSRQKLTEHRALKPRYLVLQAIRVRFVADEGPSFARFRVLGELMV